MNREHNVHEAYEMAFALLQDQLKLPRRATQSFKSKTGPFSTKQTNVEVNLIYNLEKGVEDFSSSKQRNILVPVSHSSTLRIT